MDKAVHRTQEGLEKAGHIAEEKLHGVTRRPEEVQAERAGHVLQETGKEGAHRTAETLNRAAGFTGASINPQPTVGQKIDATIQNAKYGAM